MQFLAPVPEMIALQAITTGMTKWRTN